MEDQNQAQEPAANPPAPDDLMGYANAAALANAKRASDAEARRLYEENVRMKAVMEAQAANPRPDIPQRNRYVEELASAGVPIDPLGEYVQTEVNKAVQSAFQPIVRQLEGQVQARTHMVSNYGKDFVQFEQDVAQHIQSDPQLQSRYNAIFQADPVGAVEYAFLKFSESKRRDTPASNGAPETKAQQAQAAVPSAGRSEGRRSEGVHEDRVAELFQRYQKMPSRENAEAFAKARLKKAIPDEWLLGGQMR